MELSDVNLNSPVCSENHMIRRYFGLTAERYTITCGDTLLNSLILPPSAMDGSGEIRYFARATMADHERAVTKLKMQSMLETIRALEHEPWCLAASHNDCCGKGEDSCECNLEPLVREGYR